MENTGFLGVARQYFRRIMAAPMARIMATYHGTYLAAPKKNYF